MRHSKKYHVEGLLRVVRIVNEILATVKQYIKAVNNCEISY